MTLNTLWDNNGKAQPMNVHVSSHHRQTIEKLFHHPAGGNIEWREVLSLLADLGMVTEEHNGKFTVALGPETEVFEAPRDKDIDEQMTVDLRRMLKQAGFGPDGAEQTADTRTRDHGDGQWGEPS
ncbi:hypothetical protein BH09ACT8_BH09ACT8_15470 [soil metagenome]